MPATWQGGTDSKAMSSGGGWSGAATGIIDIIGGYLAAQEASKEQRRQRDYETQQAALNRQMQMGQFDRTQNTSDSQYAEQLRRSMDANPLRDHAQYMLMARMGYSPQPFQGGSIFQPGSMGGVNLGDMSRANAQYRPGMGGTGPSNQYDQELFNRYRNPHETIPAFTSPLQGRTGNNTPTQAQYRAQGYNPTFSARRPVHG